ncbi:MAG: carboxypeptidase-like regulatory domain-containing protein, partial [Fermentimonas sp.]|nr:carboxypeptidase-like regulatory domain-containing protein [Fermentimonas sp.]
MKSKILNLTKGLMVTFLWSFSILMFAQNITVEGTVTDNNGEALIGVTVQVQGTTIGTITDMEGNYTLPNVPPNG